MLYAQFFCKSAISKDIVEACGDRAVVILDARRTQRHNEVLAADLCRHRGYVAWQFNRGESFIRPTSFAQINRV